MTIIELRRRLARWISPDPEPVAETSSYWQAQMCVITDNTFLPFSSYRPDVR